MIEMKDAVLQALGSDCRGGRTWTNWRFFDHGHASTYYPEPNYGVWHPNGFYRRPRLGSAHIAYIDGATSASIGPASPIWHVNDGPEVFVILDGVVDMKFGDRDLPTVRRMTKGDIFHAAEGEAHVAHPVGTARILVIERKGSV